MANLIKTKRGLDIPVEGKAKEVIAGAVVSSVYALVPDYFHGITPKVVVKEGDKVLAGSPLFHDKAFDTMNFVSPVSGTVIAVNRGERRKVLSITVQADKEISYEKFTVKALAQSTGDEVKQQLLSAGLWPFVKQRPYDLIANPDKAPKAIFISAFDSAPLAPDYDFVIGNQIADFQTGIEALAKLTEGKVYLGVKPGSVFNSVKNAEITQFQGPHPVGNVGVQIGKISPVNKGEVVWTVGAEDVLFIGRLYNKGIVDLTRTIALAGPEVTEPQYYNTLIGVQIENLVQGKTSANVPLRYIAGNVLSGNQVTVSEWLNPYANMVTVIDDGAETHEMFGWALPRFNKFSASRTYFTGLFENKLFKGIFGNIKYRYDARLLGGKRAIIMSGEYDKVLPMDVLPEFLFKAMIAGNIDKMEALGAYEIAPEDVALCEFVCTSKLPLQQIVRDALDNMKKELE
jgi:Na+-transporting NADH:ubiquinone oxidoreductase subunit A